MARPKGAPPILTYALTSTPNPLGVSSTNGQITITASNNAREFVNLSKIEIQIPNSRPRQRLL